MEMAEYILQILSTSLNTVYSWGFNSPRATEEGLLFRVQGFIHKGWVYIKYNEGSDLFDIDLLTLSRDYIRTIEGIYFDELVSVVDRAVEYVPNYEERVKQEYNIKN